MNLIWATALDLSTYMLKNDMFINKPLLSDLEGSFIYVQLLFNKNFHGDKFLKIPIFTWINLL